MAQALGNLIYNAISFSPAKGVVKVSVNGILEDGAVQADSTVSEETLIAVRISVVDSGTGLTEDDQKQLFTDSVELGINARMGSGLCLWISKKIVEMHGGRIGVICKGKGSGSTFYIDLPLRATANSDEDSSRSLEEKITSFHRCVQKKPDRHDTLTARVRSMVKRRSVLAIGNILEEEAAGLPVPAVPGSGAVEVASPLHILVVDDSSLIRKVRVSVLAISIVYLIGSLDDGPHASRDGSYLCRRL
jgi:hypothetical protein